MASAELQARANELNARMEGEAKLAIEDIDKNLVRSIARNSYACVVKCYDDAGKAGSSEQIEQCSRKCQAPYQMSHNIVQQEVGQFQNRLGRAMGTCQDDAQGLITPQVQNDARKMRKVEESLLKCISKSVDHHVKQLGPMKQRIAAGLKQLPK